MMYADPSFTVRSVADGVHIYRQRKI